MLLTAWSAESSTRPNKPANQALWKSKCNKVGEKSPNQNCLDPLHHSPPFSSFLIYAIRSLQLSNSRGLACWLWKFNAHFALQVIFLFHNTTRFHFFTPSIYYSTHPPSPQQQGRSSEHTVALCVLVFIEKGSFLSIHLQYPSPSFFSPDLFLIALAAPADDHHGKKPWGQLRVICAACLHYLLSAECQVVFQRRQ